MPIVSAVVMPFAVLRRAGHAVRTGRPFFDVMGIGLTATIAIARWFSERSPLDIVGLVSPAAVVVLTIALLIATICTTWLRAAALPVALAGLLLLAAIAAPDLLSPKMAARRLGARRRPIAVNRARPNEFTIDNWTRALQAETIVKPDSRKATAAGALEAPFAADKNTDVGEGHRRRTRALQVPAPASSVKTASVWPRIRRARSSLTPPISPARGEHAIVASVIVIDDATAKAVCPMPGYSS